MTLLLLYCLYQSVRRPPMSSRANMKSFPTMEDRLVQCFILNLKIMRFNRRLKYFPGLIKVAKKPKSRTAFQMSYVSMEKSQLIGDEAKIYTENIGQHPLRFGLFTQPPPLAAGDPLMTKKYDRTFRNC